MKLLRLQEVGGIDTYINPEQVTFIQAHGDAETEVWFSNGKKLDRMHSPTQSVTGD